MKLVYLANQRMPTEKAYGIQIIEMCGAFSRAGAEVTLIVPARRSHLTDDISTYYQVSGAFQIVRVSAPDFFLPQPLAGAAFWLKQCISGGILAWRAFRYHADVVYCREEGTALCSALLGRRVGLEIHNYSSSRRWIYRLLRALNVRLVCITRTLAQRMLAEGFSAAHVMVAPDGVDAKRFMISLPQREARRHVHLPEGMPIAMYVGHFYPWKGVDVLVEAARSMDGLVVLVGGTEPDIARFRVRYAGISNVMLVGHRPHAEIPRWLRAADILILPNRGEEDISRFYTSPLKLFEYMSSGTPIIASDLPSIREVLHEETAVFVPPGDPLALAGAVGDMFRNLPAANVRAQRALQEVQAYTWFSRAQHILDFI
jgi:glycosyltransferase involved in cell wall biosynthesis